MRFAILSPFYPYRGGIAQFSGRLFRELEKEGHEVRAFNFKRLYPDLLFPGKTQFVEPGDRADAIDSLRALDSVNPFSYARVTRAIRDYDPDVLVIAYWMSFFVPGYAHIANRMRRRCKVVALIHNAIPHEPRLFDKPLASLLFRQCHGFVVMSDTVRDDLLRLRPGARFLQHPHPLYDHFGAKIPQAEARQRLGIDPARRTLLFFGLIRDYKGLDLLIEAVGQLDERYQLLVAGECYGSFERYQRLIDASPARGRIFVHQAYIADSEIPVYFSAADALALPYRSATQSGVVSVAYHYDLPMVATPVGDFARGIARPGTGVVVPEVSAEAIARGIEELFTPALRTTIPARIAKEKAALSWESLTRELLDFVDTLK